MKTFLLVAVTLLFWSSAFAAIKQGLAGYSPGHVVLLRFLTASFVFFIYALVRGIRFPAREDRWKIAVLALFGITIYHGFLTFGEQYIGAGTASLIIASVPAFTAIMAYFAYRERLTPAGWGGIVLGFCGVVVITLGAGSDFSAAIFGSMLVLLAAVATSVFFVFQKSLFARYSAVELTMYFTWAGTVPFLIFLPGFVEAVRIAPLASTFSSVYLGLLPSALAYITWSLALSRAPAGLVATGLYLNPLLAVMIAWFWLGEWPNAVVWVGGGLTMAGVFITHLFGKEKDRETVAKAG